MSHSQQMVEALDRQELEEAEVQFQQALLEDSEAQLLDLGQYLESIGFYPQAKEIYEQIAESLFKHILERGQKEFLEKYMTNFASRIPVCISACLLFPVLRS